MPQAPLKILFVSSEVYPFAQTGGLGDVSGALPYFIKKQGHDVRIVTPRYHTTNKKKFDLKDLHIPLGVPLGFGEQWAGVWQGQLGQGKNQVPVYFLEHEGYFGRTGLYNNELGEGYADNVARFTLLSRGALQLAKALDFYPDIIHTNDWQTALIALYLNTWEKNQPLGQAATVLSIHNMAFQGSYPKEEIHHTQLGWEHFHYLGLEHNDEVNLLKGGLYHSSKISAVSPTYALEIQTPEGSYGLHGVLRDRKADIHGIVNGIDYHVWNPQKDPYIAAPFDKDDLYGKELCKADLQRTFLLQQKPEVPIIGLVSRLAWQKGIDILAAAIDRILQLDVQFVLLGSGETWAQLFYGDLPRRYPGQVGSYIGFNQSLAHKIEAGADLFVMPSRFEPCGLNQMYSQRYGTLPIARRTGGLNDTIIQFSETQDPRREKGSGFLFDNLTANALFDTVAWAVHTYYHKEEHFARLRRNAMAQNFSWEKSSQEYIDLYHEAILARKYK